MQRQTVFDRTFRALPDQTRRPTERDGVASVQRSGAVVRPILDGTYRFAYDVPDVRRMVVGSTCRAIERLSRLVFSWVIEPPDEHAGNSEVTVTLVPHRSGTELTIRRAKLGRVDADRRHKQGRRGAVDLLEPLLPEET